MKRRNNFDFLRLFAASLVVIGHGYALMGKTPPMVLDTPISTFGVIVFFSISGYLIAGSWEREPQVYNFFAKRALRLFPALFVVVLLTAFVLGPIVSDLPARAYFADPRTYHYLANLRLSIQYFLPGVFESNPLRNAVNGSLWSLPVEFCSYMMVPVIGLLLSRWRVLAFGALAAILASVSVYLVLFRADHQFTFYAMDLRSGTAMAAYFAAGAVIWHVRRTIPLNMIAALVAVAVYAGLSRLSIGAAQFPIATATAFLLAYVIITIGESQSLPLPDTGRYGDFSYGLYLYAFPVEQVLAEHLYGRTGQWSLIGLAFVFSMVLAILSWHFVEKHALALKPIARKTVPSTPQPTTN
ncbi:MULTISPECIES: acyltransferase [Paraburkholderia]|uniref:Acyltransferase n=1 Tax=Paraburkholderia madseniana TaxID=2599607 RepID=A0AAP5BQD5_9BURK|nr:MULTISPECIES: acyltransferase [Paraburkholderia]MCX4152218.1 acyltransferase [Paraburkholderia madseniana]MDN7155146.1 acyltransferase [Paraburkholderia sp. WS6]MDQ6414029.1 acyltransferase [Paraburkholderia madseniana]